jgi:hypothetical protein
MLLETELSDASSSVNNMDWSFDTVLNLLDDDDDDDDNNNDNSTIGAALKLVVEYGTMIHTTRKNGLWRRSAYSRSSRCYGAGI